jgi:RNA 3'-terminal phosphate cyclase (ATP)
MILAGTSLGSRGKPSESVGEEAAAELVNNLKAGGCVDEYLQDQVSKPQQQMSQSSFSDTIDFFVSLFLCLFQLIIFMGLAKGRSQVLAGPLSLHTKTSIHFTECLTGAKFTTTPRPTPQYPETVLIECEGIGFQNRYFQQQQQE